MHRTQYCMSSAQSQGAQPEASASPNAGDANGGSDSDSDVVVENTPPLSVGRNAHGAAATGAVAKVNAYADKRQRLTTLKLRAKPANASAQV